LKILLVGVKSAERVQGREQEMKCVDSVSIELQARCGKGHPRANSSGIGRFSLASQDHATQIRGTVLWRDKVRAYNQTARIFFIHLIAGVLKSSRIESQTFNNQLSAFNEGGRP